MDDEHRDSTARQRMKSDAELVAEARAGEPQAFAPIMKRYQDAVFGTALARLRDFHAAEDVTQEVLVTAFERLAALKNPSRLGAWLRTMTIHDCLDYQRRRRRERSMDEVAPLTEEPAALEMLEHRERRQRVLAAIGHLSKTQRETTTLFYINGYSVAEVAAVQEVPAGTVKSRLHDAREKLKEAMLAMVEDVLKSEAPQEDLAQRVFDVLSQRSGHEHEIMVGLRRLGAESAIDAFVRAAESAHAETRYRAVDFVGWFEAAEHTEKIVDLLKRAMGDPNQGVRAGALRAALERLGCSDERKRSEFVPLIVQLLFDPAKRVRYRAAWHLQRGWAADVPLGKAARALLEEPNRVVRQAKEDLVRAVLDAQAPHAEPAIRPGNRDERLATLKQKLSSPNSAVRAGAATGLLWLPMDMRRKRLEVIPLVVGMLTDRSRRVRWRTAYELFGWAADVPIDAVEKACRAETHPGPRRFMQELLRVAAQAQEGRSSG